MYIQIGYSMTYMPVFQREQTIVCNVLWTVTEKEHTLALRSNCKGIKTIATTLKIQS